MISAEVEPLFPVAPVAGDPLPLFPRGVPVPPRSAMNRFWPGALTWTHYLVGVVPSEPGPAGRGRGGRAVDRHHDQGPRRHARPAATPPRGGAGRGEPARRGGAGGRAVRGARPARGEHAAGWRWCSTSACSAPSSSTCSTGACPSWSRSPAGRRRASRAAGWPPCPGARSRPGCCSRRSGAPSGRPARCRWRRGSRRRCRASGSGRRRAGGGDALEEAQARGRRRARARGRAVRLADDARGAGVEARRRRRPAARRCIGDYDPHAGLDGGDPRPGPGPAARPGRAGGGRRVRRPAPRAGARPVVPAPGGARRRAPRAAAGGKARRRRAAGVHGRRVRRPHAGRGRGGPGHPGRGRRDRRRPGRGRPARGPGPDADRGDAHRRRQGACPRPRGEPAAARLFRPLQAALEVGRLRVAEGCPYAPSWRRSCWRRAAGRPARRAGARATTAT